MPRFETLDGLYPAVVTNNGDPLNMGRIKVVFPWMDNGVESNWARLVQPYAGRQRGMFFMPEVGDEVMVVFEHGDFNRPLCIGDTWNGADEPPEPNDPDGQNHYKVIESRSGHRLIFDDTPGREFIQLSDCSLQNIVRWDSLTNTITVNAKTGDIIVKASRTLNLDSRELFVRVTDSAKMSVGANHAVTVGDFTAELQTNSKTWRANTSFTATATKVDLTSSGTFACAGTKADISITQQDSDQSVVEGATNEALNTLSVKADEIYEQAESRDWHFEETDIEAQAVVFDSSGPQTHDGGQLTLTARGGEMSIRGETVTAEAGVLKLGGGIDLQPTKGVPSRQGESQGGLGPKPDWVEFCVTDASGMPLPYVECEVTLPDGRIDIQTTDEKGKLRVGNIQPGQSQVQIKDRFQG